MCRRDRCLRFYHGLREKGLLRKPSLFGSLSRRRLIIAGLPGTEGFPAFFLQPGEGASGARLLNWRLIQGKIAFGVVAAAVKEAAAGAALHQTAAAAFPGAGEGGGFRLPVQRNGIALGIPSEVLGEFAPGIAGAAQELPSPAAADD